MFFAAALFLVDLGLTLPLKAPYLYHLVLLEMFNPSQSIFTQFILNLVLHLSCGHVQPISVKFHATYPLYGATPKLCEDSLFHPLVTTLSLVSYHASFLFSS